MQPQVFSTPQERAAWLAKDYKRVATFTVLHNPRGTYQVIKAKYPDFQNWGLGAEQTQANQEALYQYIIAKAANSGDADRYVTELARAVPRNPDNDNLWIKQ